MSTSTATPPRKTLARRFRTRTRASWRTYVRATSELVDSPVVFLITSYASLILAIIFIWHLLARTGQFWNNINNILFFGWSGLLLSIFTLTQIKWVNRAIGLPVMGVFLLAASAYIYGDARIITVRTLNKHFPFSVAQLPEAIDLGSRIKFALEVAGISTLVVLVWYLVFMGLSIISERRTRHSGYYWFMAASLGGLGSLTLIGGSSLAASGSFGTDVIVVRAAYELDFTSNFRCDLVPEGARVLLSKMSDTTGYATKLSFPERPFFRMKETDKDLAESMPRPMHSYRVVACNKTDP